VGVFTAAFFLLLGYIYGDAKRRQMPAVPWVIAAFFIPNLIGILLYFLFRGPLPEPCLHYGQAHSSRGRILLVLRKSSGYYDLQTQHWLTSRKLKKDGDPESGEDVARIVGPCGYVVALVASD